MTNASLLYDKQLLVLIHMNIKRKRVNSSGARSRQVPAPRRMATPKGRIPGVAQRTGSRQASGSCCLLLLSLLCRPGRVMLACSPHECMKFWVASQGKGLQSRDTDDGRTLILSFEFAAARRRRLVVSGARVSFIVLFAFSCFLRFGFWLACSADG